MKAEIIEGVTMQKLERLLLENVDSNINCCIEILTYDAASHTMTIIVKRPDFDTNTANPMQI